MGLSPLERVNKQYNRAALIRAYIEANRRYYLHEDFKTYATGLLDALQRAFGISLSFEGVLHQEVRVLWMLFNATAQSYLSIRTPRSNFLDAGLLNTRLEELGERAARIASLEETIGEAKALSEMAHLELLDELFVLLWGPVDKIVTSRHLRKLGFDDAAEPKPWDYVDYM